MNIRIPMWIGLATAFAAPSASANDPSIGGEKITILQQRALSDAPGKKALVFTVDYMPGQRSVPHVHGGSVVAYVLEGAVVSQLDGEEPVTYRVGQSWYESPGVGHLVSRNASTTKPAKLLVWILSGVDEPLLKPLNSKSGAQTPP